jgi:hypothetical protein
LAETVVEEVEMAAEARETGVAVRVTFEEVVSTGVEVLV